MSAILQSLAIIMILGGASWLVFLRSKPKESYEPSEKSELKAVSKEVPEGITLVIDKEEKSKNLTFHEVSNKEGMVGISIPAWSGTIFEVADWDTGEVFMSVNENGQIIVEGEVVAKSNKTAETMIKAFKYAGWRK